MEAGLNGEPLPNGHISCRRQQHGTTLSGHTLTHSLTCLKSGGGEELDAGYSSEDRQLGLWGGGGGGRIK